MMLMRLLFWVATCVWSSVALTPFPLPTHLSTGSTIVSMAQNLTISCTCHGCSSDIITEAVNRYTALMSPSSIPASPSQSQVLICVHTDDLTLGPGTNESYRLTVPSMAAHPVQIEAQSVYGALHALESLSHLVDQTAGYQIDNTPVEIWDMPRFGYRGLLVDTGRHWLPVEFLKRVVDGLHANKLNLLHWHLVDSQSFACGSTKFPQLAEKGAFSKEAIYSPDDMRSVVEYARLRGVRVMPEWDMPGHGAWGKGMPSIMGCDNVMDPTQNSTYDFLNDFLGEMMSIFVDEYVFLGGDEVDASCWDANPSIKAWLTAHQMNSSQLQQYFWEQMRERVFPVGLGGRTVSVWENDLLQIDPTVLPHNTVANVYQSKATADRTIGQYKMPSVLSIAGANWYLDSQCSGYNWNSWKCRYSVEPSSNVTSQPELLPLLLGGEGAMWGEGINKHNFDAYVWHGAAAIGERLWSLENSTDLESMAARLAEHMCRMSLRGFAPGPVQPGFCPADL
eukprot:TRINITY_DN14793_c0_g1_i4.p1 TRINITY_DN14793_c0_g1~~TRINITY_DN14793_c0_g1_i4.p1  ORF type:complete len:507 (+),score=93.20 TRINITY_DN14793_c0_g1_i4:154-1674(+)